MGRDAPRPRGPVTIEVRDEIVRDAVVPDEGAREARPPGPVDRIVAAMLEGRIGRSFGRYELRARLGSGGAGVVYRARDAQLDRPVAIKLIKPTVGTERDRRNGETRLLREAQLLAQLSHPNIVGVYDIGRWESEAPGGKRVGFFVVMELVEGEDAYKWLRQRPSPAQVLRVFRQAGQGLAAAHRNGLVHRDFKPGNVLLGTDEHGRLRAKVADFGIATLWSDEVISIVPTTDEASNVASSGTAPAPRLTESGCVVGTYVYMAPEQHRGDAPDPAADQYSFCVSLYEALYGHRPFPDTHPRRLLELKLKRAVEFDAAVPVSAGVRAVIRRGLAPRPGDRFVDMDALLRALGRARGTRRKLVVAGLGGLVAVGALGAWAMSGEPTTPEETCEAHSRRMAAVWDERSRRGVEEGFRALGTKAADSAWAMVDARVSAFAGEWLELRDQACGAMRSGDDPIADRRFECLQDRYRDVAAMLDALGDADDDAVHRIGLALPALDGLAECRDEARLRQRLRPADRAIARDVAALRDRLAQALTLRRIGRLGKTQDIAAAVLEEAEGLDYEPVVLEAEALAAQTTCDQERFDLCLPRLDAVANRARAIGHDTLAIDVATRLIGLYADVTGDLDAARRWAGHAKALVERSPDPLRAASLHEELGGLARRGGETKRYVAAMRRAVALRQRHLGGADYRTAASQMRLAFAEAELGRRAVAQTLAAESLITLRAVYGDAHPEVAQALMNGAAVADMTDRRRIAVERAQEGRRMFAEVFGPDHAATAQTAATLGFLLADVGAYDEAVSMLEHSVGVFERVAGPQSPPVAEHSMQLGLALAKAGRAEEALPPLDRGIEIADLVFGEGHPQSAPGRVGRALAYVELGRFEDARAEATAVLHGAPYPAWPRVITARALTELGRVEEAAAMARQAIADCEAGGCLGDLPAALARFELARATIVRAPAPAMASAGEARALLAQSAGDPSRWLRMVDSWITAQYEVAAAD